MFSQLTACLPTFLSSRQRPHPRHILSRLRNSFEKLEDRNMMAGVVSVVTNALGDVTLRGDAADNHVEIGVFGINNALVIQGLHGTRIALGGNLADTQVLVPQVVTRDLRIDLGAGKDKFVNRQVSVGRDLIANLGAAADALQLLDHTVGRNLTINAGTDLANDDVQLGTVRVGGNLVANLGPAGTPVYDYFDMMNSDIAGNATLSNTTNSALMTLSGSTIRGGLSVQTGAGSDLLQLGGHQPLFVYGGISVNLGADADYLLLDQLTAYSTTTIDMGTGNDSGALNRASTFFGTFEVNLGAGDDRWDFPNTSSKSSTFYGTARFLGGAGSDTLTNRSHANLLNQAVFSQIETIT